MTVAAITPYVEYAENGVTLNFAAQFKYGAATNLLVRRQLADGSHVVLTYGADWNATAGPTDAGGTVTLTASIAGTTLKIKRVTARSQQTDYVTNDNFPAESHEAGLDRLTQIVQEQDVAAGLLAGRALQVPEGETVATLAGAAARASKLLGFDSLGAPIMTPESADAQVLRAELAAPGLGLGAALVKFLHALSGATARPLSEVLGDEIRARDFGVKADTRFVPNATAPLAQNRVTTAAPQFTVFDVGKKIAIPGAGPAGALLVTEIVALVTSSHVTTGQANLTAAVNVTAETGTDDTAALQALFAKLTAKTIGHVVLPDGKIFLTNMISCNNAELTGWTVRGQSVMQTVLCQFTANTPLFEFTVQDMHTINWHDMTLQHAGDQTGQVNASTFKIVGGGASNSLYQSSFHHIWFRDCYQVIDASGTGLWWGNTLTDFWATTKGRFGAFNSAAGKPHCIFQGLVSGGAAGLTLAPCNGMEAEWSMETLNNRGPLVFDGGGGKHVIRKWDNEGSTYAAGTHILFDFQNSILIIAGDVSLKGMTMEAAASVIGFRSSGALGTLEGPEINWNFAGAGISGQGAGSLFTLFSASQTSRLIGINNINGVFTGPGVSPGSQLSNVGGAASADFVRIRSWVDPERTLRMNDADLTLAADGPMVVAVSKPNTAERDIVMPYDGTGNGNNLFGGWRRQFLVLPSAVSGFAIRLRNYLDNANLAVIPAGASGRWELRWDRAHLNPSTGTISNWTFTYLGPVATETGWAADTGTAKKTANATYVPGALLPFGAAYVEAEHDAAATRIQNVENALRDATQTILSLKAALLANGTLSA